MDYEPEQIRDRLQAIGAGLGRKRDEAISHKTLIEERWLQDLRQKMGFYDVKTEAALAKSPRSKTFINITRPRVIKAEARLSDMLFPTDERNFGIKPTPVPEIERAAESKEPVYNENGPMNEASKELIKLARTASEKMEDEIADQFKEARYGTKARDCIGDAVTLGSGILKGPVVINRVRKKWQMQGEVSQLDTVADPRPWVERVDPWDFFPDMSARTLEDCEYVFERRYLSAKQLVDLAKSETLGYDAQAIRTILAAGVDDSKRTTSSERIQSVRELTGITADIDKSLYEAWEYHGTVEREDLELMLPEGVELQDDELAVFEAVVLMVGDTVIKADINPLDTEDRPYSVFNWLKDDTSIFGFGVPYVLRNAQSTANAALRMLIDNSSASAGPQILIDQEAIEPVNGSWDMTPFKMWRIINNSVGGNNPPFATFDVPNRQREMMEILQLAKLIADEESGVPLDMDSEPGKIPDTATGMSMLLNSKNVNYRLAVRNWDDDVTRTLVRRFYDWNMQYGTEPGIKGDYEVDARGTSALLTKEFHNQALIGMAQLTAAHPVFGPLTKGDELLKALYETQHLAPDRFIRTQDEIQKLQEDAQKNQPPSGDAQKAQLEGEKLKMKQAEFQAKIQDAREARQLKMQDAQADRQIKAHISNIEREIAMMRLSADQNISIEKIKADMAKETIKAGASNEKIRADMAKETIKADTSKELFYSEAQLKLNPQNQTGQGI